MLEPRSPTVRAVYSYNGEFELLFSAGRGYMAYFELEDGFTIEANRYPYVNLSGG